MAIADPNVLGVDSISGKQVIYPVNVRVRANQKDGLLRELRKRLLVAFEKEGIPLGMPTSAVVMEKAADPAAAAPAANGVPGSEG